LNVEVIPADDRKISHEIGLASTKVRFESTPITIIRKSLLSSQIEGGSSGIACLAQAKDERAIESNLSTVVLQIFSRVFALLAH
jgi:hypothetical protein